MPRNSGFDPDAYMAELFADIDEQPTAVAAPDFDAEAYMQQVLETPQGSAPPPSPVAESMRRRANLGEEPTQLSVLPEHAAAPAEPEEPEAEAIPFPGDIARIESPTERRRAAQRALRQLPMGAPRRDEYVKIAQQTTREVLGAQAAETEEYGRAIQTEAITRAPAQLATPLTVTLPRGVAQTSLLVGKLESKLLNAVVGDNTVSKAIDTVISKLEPTTAEKEIAADKQERIVNDVAEGRIGSAAYKMVSEGGLEAAQGLLQVMMLGSLIKGSPAANASKNAGLELVVPGLAGTRKAMAANAVIRGIFKFMTQPGTLAEKTKGGLWTTAFMMTPVGSSAVPKVPVAADLGANTILSVLSGAYPAAWREAGELTDNPTDRLKLFAARASLILMQDTIAATGTRHKADFRSDMRAAIGKVKGDAKAFLDRDVAPEIDRDTAALPPRIQDETLEQMIARAVEEGVPAGERPAQPPQLPERRAETPQEAYDRVLAETGDETQAGRALVQAGTARPADVVRVEAERAGIERAEAEQPIEAKSFEEASRLAAQRDVALQAEGRAAGVPPVEAPPKIAEREAVTPTRPMSVREQARALGVSDKGLEAGVTKRVGDVREVNEARDIEREAQATRRAGNVTIPSRQRISQVGNKTWWWLRRKFTKTRGVEKQLFNRSRDFRAQQRAEDVEGRIQKAEFKNAKKTLGRKFGFDAVNEGLRRVVYGEITPGEFGKAFGVSADSAIGKALSGFNQLRQQRSRDIAASLKTLGASDELTGKILDDQYYVHRFYEKHILGERFEPKPRDYQNAVLEAEAGISESLARLSRGATKAQRDFGIDMSRFLQDGDVSQLARLTPEQMESVAQLGNQYRYLKSVVRDMDIRGQEINIVADAEALADASRSIVDFYLEKKGRAAGERGGIDISALQKRHLKKVFRALYGEIKDPVFAAAKTTQVQGRLLAGLTFFNKLAQEGEGRWWSALPSQANRLITKLGTDSSQDRLRYGELAGKFVSPEFERLMTGGRQPSGAERAYLVMKANMRMVKLWGIRTFSRNYNTALLGFALGNGDIAEKGYMRNFGNAHKLMGGIMKGKPDALRTLRDLTRRDVFSEQGSSLVQDVESLLSRSPKTPIVKGLREAGRIYSYIDFPTKVASYWTRLGLGDTPKEAAEHVRKFYQHPQSVPEFSRDLSKLPFSDYPGYFFDSIRIAGNQLKHAATEARKGNMKPATGFLLSRSLAAINIAAGQQILSKGVQFVYSKIRKRDEEVEDVRHLDKRGVAPIRDFLPQYYRDAPMTAWVDTLKTGEQELVYSIWGGQSAFPAEDIIIGALQSAGSGTEFLEGMGRGLKEQRADIGMLETAFVKAVTGDDLNSDFRSKGPLESFGTFDPEFTEILTKSGVGFLADVAGGQYGSKIKQLVAIAQREEAGQEPKAGLYSPRTTTSDVMWSMAEMVRTYRVDKPEMYRMLRRRFRRYAQPLREAKADISAEVRARDELGGSTSDQQRQAEKKTRWRMEALHEMVGVVNNARNINPGWLEDEEIEAVLRDSAGVSADEATAIMENNIEFVAEFEPRYSETQLQRLLVE